MAVGLSDRLEFVLLDETLDQGAVDPLGDAAVLAVDDIVDLAGGDRAAVGVAVDRQAVLVVVAAGVLAVGADAVAVGVVVPAGDRLAVDGPAGEAVRGVVGVGVGMGLAANRLGPGGDAPELVALVVDLVEGLAGQIGIGALGLAERVVDVGAGSRLDPIFCDPIFLTPSFFLPGPLARDPLPLADPLPCMTPCPAMLDLTPCPDRPLALTPCPFPCVCDPVPCATLASPDPVRRGCCRPRRSCLWHLTASHRLQK